MGDFMKIVFTFVSFFFLSCGMQVEELVTKPSLSSVGEFGDGSFSLNAKPTDIEDALWGWVIVIVTNDSSSTCNLVSGDKDTAPIVATGSSSTCSNFTFSGTNETVVITPSPSISGPISVDYTVILTDPETSQVVAQDSGTVASEGTLNVVLNIEQNQTPAYLVDGLNIDSSQSKNKQGTLLSATELANYCSRLTFRISETGNTVVVEGKMSEALSASDITNLESIGIFSPDVASTKSNIVNFSKNPSALIDLAYNVIVELKISENCVSYSSASTGTIHVGGEDNIDGEFIHAHPEDNYLLYHHWVNNNMVAIEELGPDYIRSIRSGTTPVSQIDNVRWDPNLPKINGDYQGYAMAQSARKLYQMSNDGSGAQGWSYTNILTVPNRCCYMSMEVFPGEMLNGNSMILSPNSNHFNIGSNDSMIYIYHNGTTWTYANWGLEFASQTGLAVTGNAYRAVVIGAPDQDTAIITVELKSTQLANLYIARYLGSGDRFDPTNWSFSLVGGGLAITFRGHLYSYTDQDNFVFFNAGKNGLNRYDVVGGAVTETLLAPLGTSFKEGIGLAAEFNQLPHDIDRLPSDPNTLVLQTYKYMFTYNINTQEVKIFQGSPSVNAVRYTR